MQRTHPCGGRALPFHPSLPVCGLAPWKRYNQAKAPPKDKNDMLLDVVQAVGTLPRLGKILALAWIGMARRALSPLAASASAEAYLNSRPTTGVPSLDRLVLFDDDSRNVQAARRAGFKAVTVPKPRARLFQTRVRRPPGKETS